ncbi:hypothetical protein FG87_13885 [Nocardia vulneris]|uniref:Carrier domain-containing protein n=1 Tax=Nocardia vulneris TaxID=1141657 RepID=A0ABR4ZG07_9NOCA|nr:hypothetical protein FG87_13885 [Nocardia vulneris]
MQSPAGLWDLVAAGRDTLGPVPPDRWDPALTRFLHPDDVSRYDRGCFIDGDVWAWDPEAFSIARIEAAYVDPQFRVLLETAWEAVENAGLSIGAIRGSRTGVYVGIYTTDNLLREARPQQDWLNTLYLFGNLPASGAGRIAFGLDLRGPTMVLGTHCSSGLVAVDTACGQLTAGDCDMALAGATMLMLAPETHYLEAPYLLSTKGHCFAFDARADGYVRGEGAGVLVLKRLADAQRDGDRILAVIRGCGVNNDGRSGRLTAPSTLQQQQLFRDVVERAQIDPGRVGLVEAHGPGTSVGDPVEYTSINAVYGRGTGKCALGSVKTNIGHTEPVSGIAATIKAVQALRHGYIPPNLHWQSWNSQIFHDNRISRLFVPGALTAWPVPGDEPRLAAVSSYGIVGTNAHLILEQAPEPARPRRTNGASAPDMAADTQADSPAAFLLSGVSAEAMRINAQRLADWMSTNPVQPALKPRPITTRDVAHTLAARRWHGPHRAGLIACNNGELVEVARAIAEDRPDDRMVVGNIALPGEHAGPVFVYTGQGSQWPGMCQRLLGRDEAFTATIDTLEPLIQAESGFSVRRMITHPAELTGIARIQPTLFAIQLGVTELWRSWGVHPAGVIGHSMGEIAAAVTAGALSLHDGAKVICRRSSLMATISGGAMASVLLPAERVEADMACAGADRVSVAVLGGQGTTAVSGDPEQVGDLVEHWTRRNVSASRISVDVASHSAYVDPILDRLRDRLADIAPQRPRIGFYSSTRPGEPEPVLDGDYWAANLRLPVQFAAAVGAAFDAAHRALIECGPHPLAVRTATAIAGELGVRNTVVTGSLYRDTPDDTGFLKSLMSAHCAGVKVDWASRYSQGELVDLPPTGWHRVRHGGDQPPHQLVAPGLVGATQHGLLGGHVHDPERPGRHLWQTPVSPSRIPWLADHQVAGVPVLPGAGIAEMMLSAARVVFGTSTVTLSGLTLQAPLVLDPEPTVTTRIETTSSGADVVVSSSGRSGSIVHADALAHLLASNPEPFVPQADGDQDAWTDVVPEELYRVFRDRHGVVHGPAFKGCERIRLHKDGQQAIGTIRIPDAARISVAPMALHPVLFDSVVHTIAAAWLFGHDTEPGPIMVGGIDAVHLHGDTRASRLAHVRVSEADVQHFVASAVLTTLDGTVTAEIDGLRLVNITTPHERFTRRLSHQAWVPTDLPEPAEQHAIASGAWLVIGDPNRTWEHQLARALTEAGATTQELTCPQRHNGHLATFESTLDDALSTHSEWAGIVVTVNETTTNPAETEPALLARTRVTRAATVLARCAALPTPPRVWIVARSTADPSPATGGLAGVIRTAAYECGHLNPSMISCDRSIDARLLVTDLLTAPPAPTEIAWRGERRYSARLTPGAPKTAEHHDSNPEPVRAGGAYLVTGGLGALGLTTARWLSTQGAEHLVLCGRNTPTVEAETTISELRAAGVDVSIVLGDLADPEIAHRAVTTSRTLHGVVHAAGVIEDATLATLTPELISRVWRGKVDGAWALHRAVAHLGHELDWWINYSSAAALLGSPGQTAYAAANAWLDQFTRWRDAQGLATTSIQWGAWGEIGQGQHMATRGLDLINPGDGLDALARILTAGLTEIAYSPMELTRWVEQYPAAATSTLFADLLTDSGGDSAVLTELLAATTLHQWHGILEQHVIDCVRSVLSDTSYHITGSTSLVLLGMDSLAAVQLQAQLNHSLKIVIDPGVVWVRPTPAGIAEWILSQMGLVAAPDPDSASSHNPAQEEPAVQ